MLMGKEIIMDNRYVSFCMYDGSNIAIDMQDFSKTKYFRVEKKCYHSDDKTQAVKPRDPLPIGTIVTLKEVWRNNYGWWFRVLNKKGVFFDVSASKLIWLSNEMALEEMAKSPIEKLGWVIECESPLEIYHEESNSRATGIAAQIVIKELEEEVLGITGNKGSNSPHTGGDFLSLYLDTLLQGYT